MAATTQAASSTAPTVITESMQRLLQVRDLWTRRKEALAKLSTFTPREKELAGIPTGYVYFIQDASGLIKIGRATNLKIRLSMLQAGNPNPLSVLRHIAGGQRKESELHRRFKHLRVRGEWFRPAPELLDYIKAVQQ